MAEASYVTTSKGQQILLLREGPSKSRGRRAQSNNISAAKLIAEIVKTSLGPRGMDKMLVDSLGDVTITNDGATMLKEIDFQHPAEKNPGGALKDTTLVQGIVLDKEVVHSGMPKRVEKAKIALISAPFEIEKTE